MKHTEKNEIDLLLRSMAKRGEVSAVQKDTAITAPGTHLDADELSAYAEHALPPATRARYTSHLADCSSCRKIVAKLTMASGASVRENAVGEELRATLWQKFRALLSPPVLRYAVPALALLAAITVSVVSLRQRVANRDEFVAQNQAPAATSSESQQPLAGTVEEKNPTAVQERIAPVTKSTSAPESGKKRAEADNGEVAQTDTSIAVANNAPKAGVASGAVARPSYAPEPPAPPAAKPQTAVSDARKNEEGERQQQAAKEKDHNVVVDGVSREITTAPRSRDEMRQSEVAATKSRKAAAAGRGGGSLSALEARRADRADAKRTDENAETRVAGRRFRKQGNAWIDTAFNSSGPTITIVRNSEQYRALVADEPGIRTIAEQLHGEVVVVWKGRAYRIR